MPIPDKGIHVIPRGDSLVVELPGGGGFGSPAKRARELIEADLAAGLVTAEKARADYGHE
jgi:N-methylhydantoinase B/oxoprolinase/acetone carboxylase alpha subunit